VFINQRLHHLVIAPADQIFLFRNGDAILVNMKIIPSVFQRQALDNKRLDAQACEQLGGRAAGIAFLDGAGERALGPG
jgi:hypothetical protein